MVPLYTMADAERTLPLFQRCALPRAVPRSPTRLSYEAYDAGHILGSSCVVLDEASERHAAAADLLRRRGPAQSADHPRSRNDAARRLPDHGEHLRRPPPQARGACGQQTGRRGEPHRAAGRPDHRAGLRGGTHAATGAAAAPAVQREADSQHSDLCGQPAGAQCDPGASRSSRVLRRGDAPVPARTAKTRSASSACSTFARPPIRRS